MKRLSAREIALLCAPLPLILGGLMVRRATAPRVALEFRAEKPTMLEAFRGADIALVTRIVGDDAPNLRLEAAHTDTTLQVSSASVLEIWHHNASVSEPPGVWKSAIFKRQSARMLICAAALAPGELDFEMKTRPLQMADQSAPSSHSGPPPRDVVTAALRGRWRVARARLQPPDFARMSRAPRVVLRSVRIVSAGPAGVAARCTFDLSGPAMNARTRTDVEFWGGVRVLKGIPTLRNDARTHVDPRVATRRWVDWTLSGPTPAPGDVVGDVRGRISAANHWPLEFRVEPVHFSRVKVGQYLKFRQQSAPAPAFPRSITGSPE